MKLIAKLFTCLILTCCFISCENEPLEIAPIQQENEPENPTSPSDNELEKNFGSEVNRDFLGKIINNNKNPLSGVEIKIGDKTTQTNAEGIFIIKDATVFEKFAYIKASKIGFIQGSRSVIPTSGTNKVEIMLLEENVLQTISSGDESTISLPNNASVKLPGNYIDENKNAYSGNVQVIMHHLDPSNEDMNMQMPGMLYAADETNEEQILESYGMLAIELRGDEGQDLNLAEGTTAEITIPLASELLQSAPNSIPLWYFDETTGYWKEEGQATLQGNSYVGEVAHFSFWNADVNFPTVNLCITLVDNNGNPIANQPLTLTHSSSSYPYPTSYGYTDANGEVCGLIPANETLILDAYNYDICGTNSLYNGNIGPYANDANETITITSNSNVVTQTISGNLEDCNGNPVTNGFVELTYGNYEYYELVSNGSYQINMISCSGNNSFTIEGLDYSSTQTTGQISYTFTPPTTNLGTLTACNSSQEFIQYSIDNGNYEELLITNNIQANFESLNPNYNMPYLSIQGSSTNCFYLEGLLNDPNYTGTYDSIDWQVSGDTGFNIGECIEMNNSTINITYNLTQLGNVGEYIDINFSGSYNDMQGNPHTISGVIHVFRDQ